MKYSTILKSLVLSSALVLGMQVSTPVAHAGDDINALFDDGQFIGEVRYRYETVDQQNFTQDADASTLRTNFGYKTGSFKGFRALVEAQMVREFGSDDYNDTVNGRTQFPIVADPEVTELNRAWLSWSGYDTRVKLGRQEIKLDNMRFYGDVDWRQNDQTFDALTIKNTTIDNLELMYGYVANVNRIFGDDALLGDLDAANHIAHAEYEFADWFTLVGYGYWNDIKLAPALSTVTYGARATGDIPLTDDFGLFYEGEYASQSDHADNPTNFDEDYYLGALGVKAFGLEVQVGHEVQTGNGTISFRTPFAMLHSHNGWADVWLTTPANGLEDTFVKAKYTLPRDIQYVGGTQFMARYHAFEAERNGVDMGDEVNFDVSKKFFIEDFDALDYLELRLRYADFDTGTAVAGMFPSREKLMLEATAKF